MQEIVSESPGHFSCDQYNKTTKVHDVRSAYGFYSTDGIVTNPDPLISVSLDNKALIKLVRKCRDKQRSLQGGVVLGELRETLNLILHPAKALRKSIPKYLNTLRKRTSGRRLGGKLPGAGGERARRRRANNVIQDTWLEWSFGAVPLISDVKAGAEALAKLNYRLYPPRELVTATSRVTASARRNTTGAVNLGTNQSYSGQCQEKLDGSITYRAMVLVEVPTWPGAMQTLGFTPSDFLPTVWELIPYSFLVDYFSNIGSIIDAASFTRSQIAWVNKSTRALTVAEFGVRQVVIPGDTATFHYSQTVTSDKVIVHRKSVFRASYNSTLVPSLELQVPGMGMKWLNMAALGLRSKETSSLINNRIRL
jgi:hypothetical protein